MESKQHYQIGVFDSGVGGLTVVQQLIQKLPHESLVYFGDTARVPYGGKSKQTIIRYSIENAMFLLEKNIKLLVVACNTASAFAIHKLRKIFNIPVVDVIEPGADKAVAVTRHKRIGVLGTRGTIQSGVYQHEIQRRLPDAVVFPMACPLLTPLVEEQCLHHPATKLILKDYLNPLKENRIDTLLLGCTHYPLLRPLIEQEMGSDVTIVDSASTCAEKVAAVLQQHQLQSLSRQATYQYYVSDDPKRFQETGEMLFGRPMEHVELWQQHD